MDTDDLTLQFGVLASSCKNEKDYLMNAHELIYEIKKLDEFDLEDMFFGNLPNISLLNKCLQKIELNIAQVKAIPESKRHYEF